MDIEIRKNAYKNAISEYLNDENIYEFRFIGNKYPNLVISDAVRALEFVKTNLSKDLYEKFYSKVYPLESTKYNKNVENERLKFSKLASQLFMKKITILDAIEQANCTPAKYIYLIKQLANKYHIINMSTYLENKRYYDRITNTIMSPLHNKISGYSDVENEKIYEVIKKFNLAINSDTLMEANKYALAHSMLPRFNKTNKR